MSNIRIEDGWLIDQKNNRASIAFWGSEEKARKSLESLVNCHNCHDCHNCRNCRNCYDCHNCHNCRNCHYCHNCRNCHYCYNCHNCHNCHDCHDCHDCRNCRNCRNCYDKVQSHNTPFVENIHSKVLKAVQNENALNMDDWHTCETKHCRAGWIVHLAGKAGYDLENKTDTAFAAAMIAKRSGLPISPCRFFDNNEDAMKDIERMAALEKTDE